MFKNNIMQKIKAYILTICLLAYNIILANQGMWLPTAIPDSLFALIDEAGGELEAADIYSEQDSSLKDQVVYLSNGHSGIILSSEGLLLTNYTPFASFIEQSDSLKKGFTALSPNDETPLSNLYALQLKRTVDVTDQVMQGITDHYNEGIRKQQVDSICQSIYLSYPSKPGNIVQIEKNSNEHYFLYEYTRYDDLRLVYVPQHYLATSTLQTPWATQRQLADFCLLRIYTARDNTPAAYSTFNQPAQNLSHATIAETPKRIGDPVFYLGYPNATNRYLLTDELAEQWADDSIQTTVWQFIAQHQPIQKQATIDAMANHRRILERMQLMQLKHQQEQDFTYWAANHPHFETALRYGNLLPLLHNTYTNRRPHLEQYRIHSTLAEHVTTLKIALLLLDMNNENEAITLRQISQLYQQYLEATEKPWFTQVIDYYRTVCDTTYFPEFYSIIDKKYKGNTQKYVDYVFKKSFITNEKRFTKYLDNPTEKQRESDPFLAIAKQFKQRQRLHYLLYAQHNTSIERSKRLYRAGLYQKDSTLVLPDANYTLRLGFGTIKGYELNNGIRIDAFATLNQRNQVSYLYDPLPTLDSIYTQALTTDTIYTDFYTTCDAPNGRMGQAVYNVHGELLGIMSQTNPEAAYNTYMYDAAYQRTLVSDIQYLVFLLEQGEGAYLLDELTFGEPEQLVSVQYVKPSPLLLSLPTDSTLLNDSILFSDSIMLNNSTLLPDTITVNNDIDLASRIDSTTKRLND